MNIDNFFVFLRVEKLDDREVFLIIPVVLLHFLMSNILMSSNYEICNNVEH